MIKNSSKSEKPSGYPWVTPSMTNCANPYILELNFLDGHSHIASQQVADLTREASVSELLESLGADCLEIRFTDNPSIN
jgi:hypothetical protein